MPHPAVQPRRFDDRYEPDDVFGEQDARHVVCVSCNLLIRRDPEAQRVHAQSCLPTLGTRLSQLYHRLRGR